MSKDAEKNFALEYYHSHLDAINASREVQEAVKTLNEKIHAAAKLKLFVTVTDNPVSVVGLPTFPQLRASISQPLPHVTKVFNND